MQISNRATSPFPVHERSSRRFLIWIRILAVLALTVLACNMPSLITPTPTPTPRKNQGPTSTGTANQGASTTRVSAKDCDASSQVSVSSSGVTWSTDGENKCTEDLVFKLNGDTSKSVTIFVHEVTTGTSADNRWVEPVPGGGQSSSAGGAENFNFPGEQQRENTEFIAFYEENICLAAGNDPTHAGLTIVPIPSHCP